MYKKRILGLAIASSIALSGCLDSGETSTGNAGANPNANVTSSDPGVWVQFSPADSVLPIPNDLLFSGTVDGTITVPDVAPPVTTALNSLSGASTVAPIDIELSGLIDGDTVDGTPYLLDGNGDLVIVSGNPVPNANQNVFLIELAYASGSPLQGFSIGEPPTPVAVGGDFYEAVEKTLDGNSFIRINLKKPLKPNTRYVVAITDSIEDLEGKNINASPGLGGYAALTDLNAPLASAALAPVQALINGLWEPSALGYINNIRGLLSLDPIDDSSIALSYSFMTSDDEKVLDYIADPATWITRSVVDLVKVTAATAAVTGGAADFTAVETVVNGAFNAWLPSSLNPALAGCDAAPAGQDRFNCAGTNLYAAFEGGALGFTADFPDPEATAITMNGVPTDVTVLNPALLTAGITAGAILADQGTITVPYYSGLPAGFVDGAGYVPPTTETAAAGAGFPLKYTSWNADATLATTLNVAFYCAGLAIPQGFTGPDVTGPDALNCLAPLNPADFTTAPTSTVVNYLYPFPEKQDDVTIPILAIYPNPAAIGGATPLKTMMWGHGLGGDRTNSLGFGSLLVAQGMAQAGATAGESLNAVIAIDEPLHGVVSGPLEASAFGAVERHFGYQSGGTGPANPPELIQAGGSGSMWINPEDFLTFRDTNRQHSLDLMTVRKSLPSVTVSGNALNQEYFYSGHSLGTINSQAFVAIANDTADASDNITAAAFFTPGGGMGRLVENAPAFAPSLLDGLASQGITVDTSNYQAFVNVFQAAADGFDAVNFVDRFPTQNTPILYFEAVNDLVLPVSQASADRTFQTTTANGTQISGSVSFLSGAEPLVALAQATPLSTTPGQQAITQAVARYQPCIATHGTPSIPAAPGSAFVENLSHMVTLIASDGAAVTVTTDAVDLFQDLPLPAIIYDEVNGCP